MSPSPSISDGGMQLRSGTIIKSPPSRHTRAISGPRAVKSLLTKEPQKSNLNVCAPHMDASDAKGMLPVLPQVTEPGQAAAKVFAIAELVENILLQIVEDPLPEDTMELSEHLTPATLPARQVFKMQRVNKFVKGVIDGSILLQERMFLRASPAGRGGQISWLPAAWLGYVDGKHGHVCHLWNSKKTGKLDAINGKKLTFCFYCPRLKRKTLEYETAWLRPEASWRRMVILNNQDSTVKAIDSYVRCGWVGKPRVFWNEFNADATLGQLADWVSRRWKSHIDYHGPSYGDQYYGPGSDESEAY